MSILWQDVLYALRMLRASRSFAIVSVLTLALGIGANTAIFTLINAVFLDRLPVQDPDRLVTLYTADATNAVAGNNLLPVSFPNFKDYRDKATVFDGIAGAMFSGVTPSTSKMLAVTSAVGICSDDSCPSSDSVAPLNIPPAMPSNTVALSR